MDQTKIKRVVIAGGGTAGWMTAAACTKLLGKACDITLVESEEIGTIGVGEATIPPIRNFHKILQIDEQEFMRETHATFKLGISFEGWGQIGDQYIHSFGATGRECWAGEFQHFWLDALDRGIQSEFGDFCFELQAAKQGKFGLSPQQPINFAYHLDASRYAQYLRSFSEKHGARRVEGKIDDVRLNAEGYISALVLASGEQVEGDLFIDCTGFRGLLIEKALHTGYEDWSHWLPCDSAVAVQTGPDAKLLPYTRSIAHDCGWQWRIPLQHRVGNGLVYCSNYVSDAGAKEKLLENIDGEILTEPRTIKFKTGRRIKAWNKNCVAIGLSSGFIEPLESTSIHLIMTSIIRLMRLFPFDGIRQSAIDEYNHQAKAEVESIRDFIILHYCATSRDDSPLWRHFARMELPATLQQRIDLFRDSACVFLKGEELFRVDSWTQVMMGQGILPRSHHNIARIMNDKELSNFLGGLKAQVASSVAKLPDHKRFIDEYCKA